METIEDYKCKAEYHEKDHENHVQLISPQFLAKLAAASNVLYKNIEKTEKDSYKGNDLQCKELSSNYIILGDNGLIGGMVECN